MAVKKGDTVKVEYTGKLDDGTVFDTSKGSDPLEFQAGSGQVIAGFDNAVMGMALNQEKEVRLEPSEAYGNENPGMIKKVLREQLPKEPEPKKGMMLLVSLPDGNQLPARIKDVVGNEVSIDMNHPLAGKALTFIIKVIGISS